MGHSNRRKANRKSKPPLKESKVSAETPAAEALTIAWMLTALATVVAEIVAAFAWLVVWLGGSPDIKVTAMPRLATFVAAITGLVTLALTPLAVRARRIPPPQPIVAAVTVIGVIPCLAVCAVVYFFS